MRKATTFVPRCECGQAIGWTRLIRRLTCDACALLRARTKAGAR